MPRAGRVGRKQNVARPQNECLAVASGELKRSGKRYHILPTRRVVLIERRSGGGFFKMKRFCGLSPSEREIDGFHMRPAIGARKEMDATT